MPLLITGRGSISQLPDLSAASIFARPNSVILPSLMIFSVRFLFVFDHLLPSFLGVNFLQYLPSSILLMMLSIQPKQRASSTDSSYSSDGLPVAFLLKTSQIPFFS